MEEITIRQVNPEERDLMFQIFTLRVTCRQEKGMITREKYPFGWMDEMDAYSKHFAAFHEGNIIAAGRLTLFKDITAHPYYPVVQNIIPADLQHKPVAHLSRDQVFPSYQRKGLRKELISIRETICRENKVKDLIIDIENIGNQQEYFCKIGYQELGVFSVDKIHWGINGGLLMHKNIK